LGPFAATRFVILGNVFMVVVIGLYAIDRLRGAGIPLAGGGQAATSSRTRSLERASVM
jgi:hypothetical protein